MDTKTAAFPKRAWLTIWIRPRETLRAILNSPIPMRWVYLLAALGGFSIGIIQVFSQLGVLPSSSDKEWSFFWISMAVGLLVLAPLGGILMVWFGSVMLYWTGKWIGGKGSRDQIMAALAWAQVPSIGLGATVMGFVAVFTLLSQLGVLAHSSLLGAVLGIVFVTLFIGGLVMKVYVYFNCLAEAQNFQSAWMAVVNCMIAGAIVFAVLIVPFGIMTAILIPVLMHH